MSIIQLSPATLAKHGVHRKGQYMKLALLLSLVFFVLFDPQTNYGQSSSQAEAERQARSFWARKITKCGEDHFTKWGSDRIVQYKGASISVTPQRISETDRLNGYQYRGSILLSFRAQREYRGGRWTDWRKPMGSGMSNGIVKKSGRWDIKEVGGINSSNMDAVACAEVNRLR
jgi:hypothetical protein